MRTPCEGEAALLDILTFASFLTKKNQSPRAEALGQQRQTTLMVLRLPNHDLPVLRNAAAEC